MTQILFHLAGGIGNMIMATPAIRSLVDSGESVDLFVEGDIADSLDLFKDWTLPGFITNVESDIPDKSYDFYVISWLTKTPLDIQQIKDSIILSTSYYGVDGRRIPEFEMYLHFARAINRSSKPVKETYCGTSERVFPDISKKTLVLYPGCQERYPIKRWDKFVELASRYSDIAVVGTEMDLSTRYSYTYPEWVKKYFSSRLRSDGRVRKLLNAFGTPYNHNLRFPEHAKNYVGKLSLSDTAALIKQAGAFVGNDGGLSHVAAAVGIPTYVLFGPTDVDKNTVPMANVHIVRSRLDCQPCQFGGKHPRAFTSHYIGCPIGVRCLKLIQCDDLSIQF